MKTNWLSLFQGNIRFASIMVTGMFLFGCNRAETPSRMMFADAPSVKLGFTTQCFIQCVPVCEDSAKKFIDYAQTKGFHWLELRDPDAVLTEDQCRKIAAYARRKQIEIAYANQRGLLDSDFWPVFHRGLKNASLFNGPRTIRALIVDKNYVETKKKGLTADELRRAADTANHAAKLARRHALRLVIENGAEPLQGDGQSLFGFDDFSLLTDPDVYWQFDTANFFTGEGTRPSASQAADFLQTHLHKLAYIHLKSARNGQVLDVLGENEYDLSEIFRLLHRQNIPWVALELPALPDEKTMRDNIEKSLAWLREKEYIHPASPGKNRGKSN